MSVTDLLLSWKFLRNMSNSKSLKKDSILKQLMKSLKRKGYDDFKVKFPEYANPIDLNYNGSLKKFTPDLVGMRSDNCDLFAVEDRLNDREIQDQIAKWILFSSYSKQNGGDFYLVVPEKKAAKFESIITRMLINAKLMNIESLAS